MYSNTETCLNKNQARIEHHLMCGRNSNNNKLTQATTRHRPPESSNKRYHQSINIGLLYNKSNKTRKLRFLYELRCSYALRCSLYSYELR